MNNTFRLWSRRLAAAIFIVALLSTVASDIKAQSGDVFVLGGNRGTGLEIVKLLRA